jgi:hypothetical protein
MIRIRIMATNIQKDASEDDGIEVDREIIRNSLNEITNEVGIRLRKSSLNLPVFLTVPSSGKAMMMIATPIDAEDDTGGEWFRITEIIREVISERLDGVKLRGQDLPCAMVNTTMSAAEVTVE